MVRGGRGFASRRFPPRISSSFRSNEVRRSPWHESNESFSRSSPSSRIGGSFDSKYGSGRLTKAEEYVKRLEFGRGSRHSPERKRSRLEASRHEPYGSSFSSTGRYDSVSSDRRSYSGGGVRDFPTTASSSFPSSRREFRRPLAPSPRSTFRGRLGSSSTRVTRDVLTRDRGAPLRKRLSESSYAIRKRTELRSTAAAARSAKIAKSRSRRRSKDKDTASTTEKPTEARQLKEKSEKVENSTVTVTKEKENGIKPDKAAESKEEEGKEEKKDPEKKMRKADEKKSAAQGSDRRRKSISLTCPLCSIKTSNTVSYEGHLKGRTHRISLQKLAVNQRSILVQMRQVQRIAQNDLEKNMSSDKLTAATQFCPICKLNYKQLKSVHQSTESHKNIKKFLVPSCRLCDITFRSPLTYEMHLCSISHLKRKQRATIANNQSVDEVNLDDFTTIDSVCETDEKEAAANEAASKANEADNSSEAAVGIENIRKIEAFYCDLCNKYLTKTPNDGDPSEILSAHCKKRFHMQSYLVNRKEQERKQRASESAAAPAEENKKKDTEEQNENQDEQSAPVEDDQPPTEDSATEVIQIDDEDGGNKNDVDTKAAEDDKLWDGVDKDLGELLVEADGMPSDAELEHDSDGDEEVNNERYDRFKSGEKDKSDELEEQDQVDEDAEMKPEDSEAN